MPDIYYQAASDEHSPISSAVDNLAACAARLCYSILLSLEYLPEGVPAHLRQLLTADTLWTLGLVLAGWAIASLVGGPIGVAVDFLLLAYGLYSLYRQLASTWESLKNWALTSYKAKDEQELRIGAKFFADAVSEGALSVLEVIIAHRVFKAVQGPLSRRVPPPEWLKAEFEARTKASEARTKAATEREPRRAGRGALGEAAGTIKVIGAGTASSDLADAFPTLPVVGGLVGLLALGATAAYLASESGGTKRGKG